jgi:hypothetical protein
VSRQSAQALVSPTVAHSSRPCSAVCGCFLDELDERPGRRSGGREQERSSSSGADASLLTLLLVAGDVGDRKRTQTRSSEAPIASCCWWRLRWRVGVPAAALAGDYFFCRCGGVENTDGLSCIPRRSEGGWSIRATTRRRQSDAVCPRTPHRQLALVDKASVPGSHTLISSSRCRTCPRARSDAEFGLPGCQNPQGRLGVSVCSAEHAFVFFSAISAPNGLRIRLERRACARTEARGRTRGGGASRGSLGGQGQATAGRHRGCCASTSACDSALPSAVGRCAADLFCACSTTDVSQPECVPIVKSCEVCGLTPLLLLCCRSGSSNQRAPDADACAHPSQIWIRSVWPKFSYSSVGQTVSTSASTSS